MFGNDIWESVGHMQYGIDQLNEIDENDPKLKSLLKDIVRDFYISCNNKDYEKDQLRDKALDAFSRIKNPRYKAMIKKLYAKLSIKKLNELKDRNRFIFDL